MSWLKLDDSMPEHPKVAALTDAAFRHHVAGLAYCARLTTDGFIPARIAGELTTPETLAELTAEQVPGRAPLWESAERGWEIHDYLEYNPSRAYVTADRQRKSEAGKRGASKRYGTSHSTRNGERLAPAIAEGIGKRGAPVPDPYPSTVTVEEGREQRAHTEHGGGEDPSTPPTLPPQLQRILVDHVIRDLKPGQVKLVAAAWEADTNEIRHSLGDVETAENPTAMLVSIAKRILPSYDDVKDTAEANSKRAGAVAACRRVYAQGIADGENPDALRESLERDYHRSPGLVTEALGPPTTKEDIPL